MSTFLAGLSKFFSDFLSKTIGDIFGQWSRRRESQKRGAAESKVAAYEEFDKRRERADEKLTEPVKTGDDLVRSIRKRSND